MDKKLTPELYKQQRVGIFVDVQNMYYSARNIYKSKVNFKILLREAVRGRYLIRAIAYVIKADVKDEANFFEALKSLGYEVKAKDLQVFYGGAKKGDWDIGIAMDTIELASKLDAIVLVSGDGDFVPLLQHLKHALGCYVEVLAFRKTSSQKLIEEADNFIDMDQSAEKFLIRAPRKKAAAKSQT
ncbi:MAG: NYN domain-containing protein [Candidatus Aminicenantes bacterium]|nr:NYN domain-containing protein [Candidatus Aminicenantes bacterium]